MTALLALLACGSSAPAAVELTGLAASSLTDALPKVADAWGAGGGVPIVFTFDSSSRLARQVEAGAPADVVLFADRDTIQALDAQALLLGGSRRELLGNALVVIVPVGSAWAPANVADLAAPALERLALAGENVPAGKYARSALQSVWGDVGPKVVEGDNVRTTLAWVTRGEAEAGVVYATDALAEPGVKVAFVFPPASHPPIVYPGAVLASSKHADEAAAFLAFCASPDAQALFAAAGFLPPPPP